MSTTSFWQSIIKFITSLFSKGSSGGGSSSSSVDELDVSKTGWRFANVPVDDIFRKPTYSSSGTKKQFNWEQTRSLDWPDRGPQHKMIQSALVCLFVRDGNIIRCVVDSVPKDKHFKSLENIDPGHHCDVQPKHAEVVYWCLCSEEGTDRRTNIVKAPPYP